MGTIGSSGVQSCKAGARELSRSLLKFAERDGTVSYPQFTSVEGTDRAAPREKI